MQFVLLACTWWLNTHEGQPNELRLAQQAEIDVKMTSPVLRTLELKGLIERTTDPQDTRAKRLTVSEQGEALAPRAIAVVEAVDRAFFPTERKRETLQLLRSLSQGPQHSSP